MPPPRVGRHTEEGRLHTRVTDVSRIGTALPCLLRVQAAYGRIGDDGGWRVSHFSGRIASVYEPVNFDCTARRIAPERGAGLHNGCILFAC